MINHLKHHERKEVHLMAIINEIKCARCDRKYSGVRSRCPYCGARRIGRGKYSEDSDNAKGKMLISVLILAVFTVAAGILLFTTPAEADDTDSDNGLGIDLNEEGNESMQGLHPEPSPTPTPTPEPTIAPQNIESIEIWVPNSHKVEDFTLSVGQAIELTAKIEPVSVENDYEPDWEISSEHGNVFEFAPVVGGIRLVATEAGHGKLIVTAGDKSAETWVRVN